MTVDERFARLERENEELKKRLEALENKNKKFIPPTFEEVLYYLEKVKCLPNFTAREVAEKFINHYESNGWKVGKVKMVKWQNAIPQFIPKFQSNANSKQYRSGASDRRTDALRNYGL